MHCNERPRNESLHQPHFNYRRDNPLPQNDQGFFDSGQFSPDGLTIAMVDSFDRAVHIWDARTGQPIRESIKHEDGLRSARFSSDGGRLLTASSDWTSRLWDIRTGQALIEPLRHQDIVWSAEFSPDEQRIVTASSDGAARIWDARSGQPLTELLGHGAAVFSAFLTSDGQWLCTVTVTPTRAAGYDGRLERVARIWETPSCPLPIPDWVPRLAEAVAQQRLNSQGVVEFVSVTEFLMLKKQVEQSNDTEYFHQWAKWFFANRSERNISPASPTTVSEYVRRRIDEKTVGSLREAVQLSPTNGVALARLAQQVLAANPAPNLREISEAVFLSLRAMQLSPNDKEIESVRSAILKRIGEGKP